MKKLMMVAVLFALCSMPAFSQSNASISGIVTDASQAVLPGVSVTATNTDTGIAKAVKTNAAGVYSFAGMQVGIYRVTAELSGFQTQSFKDIKVGPDAQIRLNFSMEIRKLEQSVEVSVESENLILESTSSAGTALSEKRVAELPIVNSNVLSLIKVMGGVTLSENPIFGADDTQFAGISASNVNLTRDGVTVNDVRWATGLNSPVYLNPEMVGEFKMVLAPVDAEMGRGNGQVQVVTRSGGNAYHGSLVWNNQNTKLDSNEWVDNRLGVTRDWRNQNEFTASIGGPIVKNKTFFFASWNQQFSRIRQNNVNLQVPTACARKTIFRYFDSYSNGNALANTTLGTGVTNPATTATVDTAGNPVSGLMQVLQNPVSKAWELSNVPALLNHQSIFGPLKKVISSNDCSEVTIDPNTGFPTADWVDYTKPWDTLRTPDTTGYLKRFMALIPPPNNYQIGEGLNWGGFRYTRHLNGGDNIYGIGEGPNRKQLTFRIDHNFSASHRISGTYSYEKDIAADAFATMPENSWGGAVLRYPQNFSVNFVSTIRPTLLNEFRVGMSRTASHTYDPYYNPANKGELKKMLQYLYPTPTDWDFPLLIGLGNPGFQIGTGQTAQVWGTGRGNMAATWGGHDPRWNYADTVTWTKGRHSFRFGVDYQRTQSYQEMLGQISFGSGMAAFPSAQGGGAVAFPNYGYNSGLHDLNTQLPLTVWPNVAGRYGYGNIISGAYNLMNLYAGNVQNVRQWRFVNRPTDTTYNDISKGEDTRVTDYRQNQISFFTQDDWRITDTFTVNLGLRWEWYGVPYLKGGMTAGILGGVQNAFGLSGTSFADWMKPGTMNPDGSVTYKGQNATLAFIGPGSPHPDQQSYNDDFNNFGPAVGFAWQIPWLGKGKTVLRGGYQLTYLPGGRAAAAAYQMPKIEYYNNYTPNSSMNYINLSNIMQILPVVPVQSNIKPIAADPVVPVTQRSQGITVFDPGIVSPYVQNLTMSLTHNLTSNVSIDFRYIGTLSRKTQTGVNLNSANIWNNGLKEAFEAARYGGESLLLDKMFNGINLVGNNNGPVGTVYKGVLQTGAMHLRASSSTRSALANGNYISLAGTLNTLNYNTTFNGNQNLPPVPTDTNGMVLRQNHFPENFISTSPQFSGVTMMGNNQHANYHSLQAQITIRPTHGFNLGATYTWSRNLGHLGVTDPRDLGNRDDYGLNGMNRSHAVALNGAFELPFGPGRWLLNSSNGIIQRVAGGWQMAWIGNFYTGRPFSFSAGNTTLYGNTYPNLVGEFNPKSGHVVWPKNSPRGYYFYDSATQSDRYISVRDPQCNNITTLQGLNNQCTIYAIAEANTLGPNNSVLPTTQYVFTNPWPLQRGNYKSNQLTQPAIWSMDMTMSKVIRITEGKSFQLRVDATNIFNHPNPTGNAAHSGTGRVMVPGAPNGTMGLYFDTVTYQYRTQLGYLNGKVGARTWQARLRFDF